MLFLTCCATLRSIRFCAAGGGVCGGHLGRSCVTSLLVLSQEAPRDGLGFRKNVTISSPKRDSIAPHPSRRGAKEKGLPKVLAPELGVAGFGQRLSGRLATTWPYTLNCPVRAVLERMETWTERVLGRPERLGLALHCFSFFLFLFMCLCRSTC